MSTLFSDGVATVTRSIVDFSYPSISREDRRDSEPVDPARSAAHPSGPSPEEVDALARRARSEGEMQAERRVRQEYEQRATAERAQLRQALDAVTKERTEYFARIESQVVQLTLAIARKILHREANVDPALLAALVRIAIENMNAGSDIKVRVRPEESEHWRRCLAVSASGPAIQVIEDPAVELGGCILETQMGSADFGIDAQLKEVERGFLDLLAQRPA